MSQILESPPTALPTPNERPQADIVIYDGQCRICTAQIRNLARFDRGKRLAYLSLHDPRVAERFPDLTHEMMMEQMFVIDQQGRRHAGAESIRYLSRRLPLLWLATPILHFPGSLPLWNRLYRWIAQRRYRYGKLSACDDDACRLHRR